MCSSAAAAATDSVSHLQARIFLNGVLLLVFAAIFRRVMPLASMLKHPSEHFWWLSDGVI
jgi:hypothetical protein